MTSNLSRPLGHALLCFLVAALPHFDALSTPTDPDLRWRMLRTPHFTVLYAEGQKEVAERYAQYAEESFEILTRIYPDAPDRTALLVWDGFDLANGSATGFPYPIINVYPTLPTMNDNINTFGNWARELTLHEFTHILQFEPATGFWRPLRWVFGTIVRPTGLLPRWYMEGVAVEIETREGDGGRLRNPYYHAIMRAMALDRSLQEESLARMGDWRIPTWPGGNRPYVFGAFTAAEMSEIDKKQSRTSGELEVHPYLFERYGGRVPYFLATPAEERLGQNYEELFASTLTRAEQRAEETAAQVRTRGETPTTRMDEVALEAMSPRISPDGRYMAFWARTPESEGQLFVIERDFDGAFRALRGTQPVLDMQAHLRMQMDRLEWHPDGNKILFAATFYNDRFYLHSDVYEWDVQSRQLQQLTKGLRALEPAYSPDGSRIVFRKNVPGTSQLAEMKSDGSDVQILYSSEKPEAQVNWPLYISDKEIAFVERSENTYRFLILDVEKRTTRERFSGYQPLFPQMRKNRLLFTSEKTGIGNVYLSDETFTTARPITNVATRTTAAELDSETGDLYVPVLNGRGVNLERISSRDLARNVQPPSVPLGPPYQWQKTPPPEISRDSWKDEEFSAGWFLWPRYWLPSVSFVDSSTIFGGTTSASDPLSRHSYEATLLYDTGARRPSVDFVYRNAQTRLPVTVGGYDRSIYLQGIRGTFQSQRVLTSFELSPLLRMIPLWDLRTSWIYDQAAVVGRAGDSGQRTFLRQGFNSSLSFSNLVQRGFQISPERGVTFSLNSTNFISTGGFEGYDRFSGFVTGFYSRGLPERHAIMGRLQGITHAGLDSRYLGATNVGLPANANFVDSGFVTRGYPSGFFWAQNVIAGTLEYRLPLVEIQQGGGTQPLFTRRLHAAFVMDAFTLKGDAPTGPGGGFERSQMGRPVYVGGGAELKLDLTLFYWAPLTLVGGLYSGDRSVTRVDGANIAISTQYQYEF